MLMNEAAAGRLQAEINITPMIDVLLVLLIIFMVIGPAISRGEATVTPHNAPVVAPTDEVVLEVLRDSAGEASFRINQRAISRADLPARLGELYRMRAQRVLFVKADHQLSFGWIAEVIDVSHAAGADRICLMTSL